MSEGIICQKHAAALSCGEGGWIPLISEQSQRNIQLLLSFSLTLHCSSSTSELWVLWVGQRVLCPQGLAVAVSPSVWLLHPCCDPLLFLPCRDG